MKSSKSSKGFFSPFINLHRHSEKMLLSKKEKYLTNYKLDLGTILAIIKNYEIAILTMPNKPTIKDIKNLLLKLFHQLENFKNEKNSELSHYEKSVTSKKHLFQKQAFIDFKYAQLKNEKNFSKKRSNLYQLNSELILLKFLNFKVENEIKYINNRIEKTTDEYKYINLCMKYLAIEEKENMCIKPKFYPFITKLLEKQIKEAKEKHNLLISAENALNEDIEKKKKELDSFTIRKNIENINKKE